MELRRYLTILRHRLPLIIVIVAVAVTAGYLITPRQDTYTAATTVYVGGPLNLKPTAGQVTFDRVAALETYMNTFSRIVKSPSVADDALAAADVERSPATVTAETSAEQIPQTVLFTINVTDPDPAVAQSLANAVTDAFIDHTKSIAAENDPSQFLRVQQRAPLPAVPNGTGLLRNLALAGGLGVIVALLLVALLEYLDITIRGIDDVERRVGLPVLGAIPSFGDTIPETSVLRVRSHQPRRGSRVTS